MSSSGVSVLYAGTTRLYPRPYVSRRKVGKQEAKTQNKLSEPFFELDRLLALAASNLEQSPLPSHRWTSSATSSPAGAAHSVLLAQQSLVAIYFANRLQVYNLASSSRLFEFVFESPGGSTKWAVTDVVECSLPMKEGVSESTVPAHTMLVSVMVSAQESRIYLIDFLSAVTLFYISVPYAVTKMLPAWNPTPSNLKAEGTIQAGGLLNAFEMPLLFGTRGGSLMALDLTFDYAQLDDETCLCHTGRELRHGMSNYERESWKTSHGDDLLHAIFNLSAAWIGPDHAYDDQFYYLSPRPGEFVGTVDSADPIPKSCVTITALQVLWPAPKGASKPASSSMDEDAPLDVGGHHSIDTDDHVAKSNWIFGLATPLIIVGYNFGSFQIWSLDTMELLYCSPIAESRAAVTRFETQSLHQMISTPSENKVLLWVARGSLATTHTQQAHAPSITAYSLSLIRQGASGRLLGSSAPPTAIADCIASIVLECVSYPSSPFDGNYYGQVHLMQALPCWESRALDFSSIAFVVETFPAHDSIDHEVKNELNEQASRKHTKRNGATSDSKSNPGTASQAPPKAFECFILSTSALQTESERLFTHPDQLMELSMPYQLTPLNGDLSHLLSFDICPSSIQHYFPGTRRMSRDVVERAQVSFDSVAITEDAVWKIGYASYGQQILNALSEQGHIVFDHPELIESLEHLNYVLPTSEEEAHHLRNELFSLALHNNLGTVISDYVLDASHGALANLNLTSAPHSSSLHQVLAWSRTTFKSILDTAHALADTGLKASDGSSTEVENCVLELRQARRLLKELYNIIKALILRYQHQKTKWDAQEVAMQRDLDDISIGCQFIESSLYFIQNSIPYDLDSLNAKVALRRTRAVECAKNSPTAWDVTYDAKSPVILSPSGAEATRLTVSPRAFNSNTDGLLLIDHLMAALGSGEEAETLIYPFESVFSAVSLTRGGNPLFVAQKHQVIFYMLLDVSDSLAVDFANRMLLTLTEQKLVRGVHAIDSNNYDLAMKYLNDAQVTGIVTDDLALKILRALNDVRAFPHALAFYRLRQPPLDSLDAVVLALYILLSNGLVSDAFFMVRAHSRTTLDSFDPSYLHPLFFHFLNHSYHNHILKDVFQLPFDAIESEALKQFLLWCQERSKAIDMHLVFLLQRARVADAVQWYHEQNYAHNDPIDRDNELMKMHLVNNYIRTLPPVLRVPLKPAPLPSLSMPSKAFTTTNPILSAKGNTETFSAAASSASTAPSTATPSKKIVTKLFSSSRQGSSVAHLGSSASSGIHASDASSGARNPGVIASTSRFAPASLGPALLSPTNPGRFARSPALFRPTIVLSTPSKSTANTSGDASKPTNANGGPSSSMDLDSGVPRPSLFSDRDITANLISTPAKKLFAASHQARGGNVTRTTLPISSTPTLTSTNSIPAHMATVVSQDSLIHRIEDVDDDDLVMIDLPTAPISTPTKKVMDNVKRQSEEVRKQSKAIGKSNPLVESESEDDDEIIRMDVMDDVEEEEEHEEDDGEEEEEDDGDEEDVESDIDDETLEKIRGGESDVDGDEHHDHGDERDDHPDETLSRASRRSRGSTLSRLSEITKSTRSSRQNRTPALPHTRNAGSKRSGAAAGAPRRSIRQKLAPLSEEHSSPSSPEPSPRYEHDDSEAPHPSSKTRKTGRRSNRSATSSAQVSEADEPASSALTTPAGSTRSRRSSRVAEPVASTPSRQQRRSSRISSHAEPEEPLTEISHRREPFRSTRTRRSAHDEEEEEETPKPKKLPKRTSRRLSAMNVDESEHQDHESEEEEASEPAPPQRAKRTGKKSSKRSAAAMAVDEPNDPEHEEPASTNTSVHSRSGLATTRRSSRLNKSAASSTLSDVPVEPLGVHPEAEPAHEQEHSDDDEISGETIRIRRSSRNKAAVSATSATPSSVASRTRSLRVKAKK